MGLKRVLSSSIGGKMVMAITGLALFLFVIAHMLGNLQIYAGQDTLNTYAHFLKSKPVLLWTARIGLLVFFMVHIIYALRLKKRSADARPVQYVHPDTVQASMASRVMLITGLTILAFVIYHLLHFTVGLTNPDHYQLTDPLGRHDVYSMVVKGFQNPAITSVYIVFQLLLGWHLIHGASSAFQSLGISHPYWSGILNRGATALVVLVVIGNISIPISCLIGLVKLPAGAY